VSQPLSDAFDVLAEFGSADRPFLGVAFRADRL
jgi:hypothetical protein